jgi:Bacteriophage Sf6, terminase small subunit-like
VRSQIVAKPLHPAGEREIPKGGNIFDEVRYRLDEAARDRRYAVTGAAEMGFDASVDAPTARESYARARQSKVEKWVDEMVPMTDKVIGQEMAIVTATRNAVDVRKWVASRLMPNEYGDQPGGVTINNQTNVMVVSDERLRELQALRQRMLEKQKGG